MPQVRSVTPISGGAQVEAGGRSLVLRIMGADLQLLDSVAVVRHGRTAPGVKADLEPLSTGGDPVTSRRVLVAAATTADEAADYVLQMGVRGRPWPVESSTFRVVTPSGNPVPSSPPSGAVRADARGSR